MNNLSHQIYRYRILWAAGWAAMLFTIIYTIFTGEWYWLLGSFLWARVVSVFGIQISLHRYFSHRSFETGKWRRRFLLWFTILTGEGSPIAWSTHHRHHHRFAETDRDIHSPHKPFGSLLLSAFTWQVQPVDYWLKDKRITTMTKDLLRDKEIKFVDKHYYHFWIFLVILSLLINWKFCVFFILAPAGWALFFAIFVNTVSHLNLPGSYRNYNTEDQSYNNKWVHWFVFGKGLHNNHHYDGSKYNQAFKPGEFDLTGWLCNKLFVKKI